MTRDSLEQAKQEQARIARTKPSLPLLAYAKTYRHEMYGEVVVAAERGALVMRFGPLYAGDLAHWHFDTFQATWRDPEQGSDRITFGLNAEGSVGHLRWPGLGEFARDEAP